MTSFVFNTKLKFRSRTVLTLKSCEERVVAGRRRWKDETQFERGVCCFVVTLGYSLASSSSMYSTQQTPLTRFHLRCNNSPFTKVQSKIPKHFVPTSYFNQNVYRWGPGSKIPKLSFKELVVLHVLAY